MALQLNILLAREPSSPGSARSTLDALVGEIDDLLMQDVRLLVSELVTNSVKHPATPEGSVRVEVLASSGSVQVAVVDPGPGFEPRVVKPDPHQESGRGMYIVDRLADRWGVDNAGHTRVWFEIGRARPPPRPASVNSRIART